MSIEDTSTHKPSLALVSKAGAQGGGASRVACQLHDLLRNEGSFLADHWTGESCPTPPRISLRGGQVGDLLFRSSRVMSRKLGYPDFINITRRHLSPAEGRYSIYHLHDIAGTVSPLILSFWSRRTPLIWTFHDCSPFTGGCLYPMDCQTYLHGCGHCPQLERWPLQTSIDHTTRMLRYKLDLINRSVAAVICPSEWIAGEAVKAGIKKKLLHVINNAVDTTVFRPLDRRLIRQQLDLPVDENIILLSSVSFSNPYKGTSHALQAIAAQKSNFNVLVVGQHSSDMSLPEGPNYLFRDFTSESGLLASYYAASDVLLFPSLAENFSLALIESMACATPAVTFDTGGITEMVEHEVNGWAAPRGDTKALAQGLEIALGNEAIRTAWGNNARRTTLAKCSEQGFLQAHLQLYRLTLEYKTTQ